MEINGEASLETREDMGTEGGGEAIGKTAAGVGSSGAVSGPVLEECSLKFGKGEDGRQQTKKNTQRSGNAN